MQIGAGSARPARRARAFGRAGAPGAFTLLELVVVLAMVALMAGLVLGSMGSSAPGSRQRTTMGALHAMLSAERVMAMDTGAARTVVVRRVMDERGAGAGGGGERDWGFEVAVLGESAAGDGASGDDSTGGDGGAMVREGAGRAVRTLDGARLELVDSDDRRVEELSVRFDRRGRSDARVWVFLDASGRDGSGGGGGDDGLIAGAIGFDPVSGAAERWDAQRVRDWFDEMAWERR